jgi:hypothetical protein
MSNRSMIMKPQFFFLEAAMKQSKGLTRYGELSALVLDLVLSNLARESEEPSSGTTLAHILAGQSFIQSMRSTGYTPHKAPA